MAKSSGSVSALSHLNERGEANMVDVGDKSVTQREASAQAVVRMHPETFAAVLEGDNKKGDVFAVSRIAGIQAAKQTAQLIPLCHQLPLSKVSVEFEIDQADTQIRIVTLCKTQSVTGVEMEALTAASVAALTLYDMCKAIDKHIAIQDVYLLSKQGGKTGNWQR